MITIKELQYSMTSIIKHRQALIGYALYSLISTNKNPTTNPRSRLETFNIPKYLREKPRRNYLQITFREFHFLKFHPLSSRFPPGKNTKNTNFKYKTSSSSIFFQQSKINDN